MYRHRRLNSYFLWGHVLMIERHVVLVAPDVHWNTGNIGRTCLGADAFLHLVKPLGFSLDAAQVKRAGLDYWPRVKLRVWDDFESLVSSMKPLDEEVILLSKNGESVFWDMPKKNRMFLVFGSETKGLPDEIFRMFPGCSYHIPISEGIRSLNLSTAAGIVLYESLRGLSVYHGWGMDY